MSGLTDVHSTRRWGVLTGAAFGLAVAVLAAPAAAMGTEPNGPMNSVWWVSGAVVDDDPSTAYLSVMYKCAPETNALLTVHLTQSEGGHGVTQAAVACSGKPDMLTVQIASVSEPWQLGHAVAGMDITDNVGDRDQVYPVTVKQAIHPW